MYSAKVITLLSSIYFGLKSFAALPWHGRLDRTIKKFRKPGSQDAHKGRLGVSFDSADKLKRDISKLKCDYIAVLQQSSLQNQHLALPITSCQLLIGWTRRRRDYRQKGQRLQKCRLESRCTSSGVLCSRARSILTTISNARRIDLMKPRYIIQILINRRNPSRRTNRNIRWIIEAVRVAGTLLFVRQYTRRHRAMGLRADLQLHPLHLSRPLAMASTLRARARGIGYLLIHILKVRTIMRCLLHLVLCPFLLL